MPGMLGVVLAGGKGERLQPLSASKPKPFIRIAGSPLYRYTLEEIDRARAWPVALITRAEWLGLVEDKVKIVTQRGEGFEAALLSALDYAADEGFDSILVGLAGFLAAPRGIASSVVDYFNASGYQVVIAVTPVATGLETYGFVDMEPSGPVRRVEDPFNVKPGVSAPGYVFAGVMALSPRPLAAALRSSGSFTAAVNSLASEGLVGAVVWSGEWVEIGYPWDILYAKNIALSLVEPVLSPQATIPSSASVTGHATIRGEARLGDNTVVEGPAYVGRNARIGHNTVIVNSIIEDNSEVGHGAVIVDSVVMEGARVGSNVYIERSVIGPGASVGPGSVFEAGKPARLPERLKSVVEDSLRPVRLGAIVAPGSNVPPLTRAGNGETLG